MAMSAASIADAPPASSTPEWENAAYSKTRWAASKINFDVSNIPDDALGERLPQSRSRRA
jgi:hypothetical protein